MKPPELSLFPLKHIAETLYRRMSEVVSPLTVMYAADPFAERITTRENSNGILSVSGGTILSGTNSPLI